VRYVETPPSRDLAPFVQCYWELEGGASAFAEPIFPDGRVEIVIHLGDRPTALGPSTSLAAGPRQPEVMVVGQMTTALRVHSVERLHAVGVRFTPTGARGWLGAPVHNLTNSIEDVDSVRPNAARRLRLAVEQLPRFAALERTLREDLLPRNRSTAAVEWAVSTTVNCSGRVSIDRLAHSCGVSGRQLERQYLDAVGLTPKIFARTIRFQRALQALRCGRSAASVATACGFADQSHLAREFRRFAGAAAREVNLAHVVFVQDSRDVAIAD
jgi:AraC-like DNA-binding protein